MQLLSENSNSQDFLMNDHGKVLFYHSFNLSPLSNSFSSLLTLPLFSWGGLATNISLILFLCCCGIPVVVPIAVVKVNILWEWPLVKLQRQRHGATTKFSVTF